MVLVEQEAGWAPESVCTWRRREKPLSLPGIEPPSRSARSLVTILTELMSKENYTIAIINHCEEGYRWSCRSSYAVRKNTEANSLATFHFQTKFHFLKGEDVDERDEVNI
jgi:hypothetical protein